MLRLQKRICALCDTAYNRGGIKYCQNCHNIYKKEAYKWYLRIMKTPPTKPDGSVTQRIVYPYFEERVLNYVRKRGFSIGKSRNKRIYALQHPELGNERFFLALTLQGGSLQGVFKKALTTRADAVVYMTGHSWPMRWGFPCRRLFPDKSNTAKANPHFMFKGTCPCRSCQICAFITKDCQMSEDGLYYITEVPRCPGPKIPALMKTIYRLSQEGKLKLGSKKKA